MSMSATNGSLERLSPLDTTLDPSKNMPFYTIVRELLWVYVLITLLPSKNAPLVAKKSMGILKINEILILLDCLSERLHNVRYSRGLFILYNINSTVLLYKSFSSASSWSTIISQLGREWLLKAWYLRTRRRLILQSASIYWSHGTYNNVQKKNSI